MPLKLCYSCNDVHAPGPCPARSPWGGPASQATKRRLLVRDGYTCQECGCAVTFKTAHLDHRITRAMGGPDTDRNLRTLCADCNLRKGNS